MEMIHIIQVPADSNAEGVAPGKRRLGCVRCHVGFEASVRVADEPKNVRRVRLACGADDGAPAVDGAGASYPGRRRLKKLPVGTSCGLGTAECGSEQKQ